MSETKLVSLDDIDPTPPPSADDDDDTDISRAVLSSEASLDVRGITPMENNSLVNNTTPETDPTPIDDNEHDSVSDKNAFKSKNKITISKEDVKVFITQTTNLAKDLVKPHEDQDASSNCQPVSNISPTASSLQDNVVDDETSVRSYDSEGHENSMTDSLSSFQERFKEAEPLTLDENIIIDRKTLQTFVMTSQVKEEVCASPKSDASNENDATLNVSSVASSEESALTVDAAATPEVPPVVPFVVPLVVPLVAPPSPPESDLSSDESFFDLKGPDNKSQTMALAVEEAAALSDSEATTEATPIGTYNSEELRSAERVKKEHERIMLENTVVIEDIGDEQLD